MAESGDSKSIQQKYEEIKTSKEQLERDFGQKRAKFKQMYLECEAELNAERELKKKLEKKIEDLNAEIEGVRTAAQLSEETIRDEIGALKLKHQEELASLQHIWQEAMKEGQIAISRQLEEEKHNLRRQNQALEQQVKELRSKLDEGKEKSGGDGLMSMVSQAIRRNTNSPVPSKENKDESQGESLEHSMKKAQENAEAWRSIVMPLEQQISSLKSKLKEANERIKQYEAKEGVLQSSTDPSAQASIGDLQERAKELQNYLDAERSSRTDLEMFVAVLNTQKGVLQEDADKLRRELHNVCRLLEEEKTAHRGLKQTWKLANEQFLEQQTILLKEIEQMKITMTPSQLEHVSRQMRHSKVQPIKTVAEEPYTVGKDSKEDLITFTDSPVKTPAPVSPSDVNVIVKRHTSDVLKPTEDKLKSQSSRERHLSDGVRSLEEGEELQEDDEEGVDHIFKQTGFRKSNSSSDLQTFAGQTPDQLSMSFQTPVKSLSQGDLADVNSLTPMTDISASWVDVPSPDRTDIEGKLHLNETGWSTMKESGTVSQFCMMCQNYEKQLQRLQSENTQLQAKSESLHSALKREKEAKALGEEKVEQLEKSMQSIFEDLKSKQESCWRDQEDAQNELVKIQQEFASAQEEMLSRLQEVSEDRDRILAEMESIQEEKAYRDSMGHLSGSVPETVKLRNLSSLDGTTASLTDQLSTSTSTSEGKEEELRSEIMFLKDRVMAEQYDRENMESLLQQELDEARSVIAHLKGQLVAQRNNDEEGNLSVEF